MTQELASIYPLIKEVVRLEGYGNELSWQESIDFESMDEGSFLKELAWVILSSGMKEQTIRSVFKKLTPIFQYWVSATSINEKREECYIEALRIYNHRGKISAILHSAKIIHDSGFYRIKQGVQSSPFEVLRQFPYIGPVTVYHLAKNIGLQVAKPDRHLVRIAHSDGYDDVQVFCQHISSIYGDSIPVVDIVFWRFANIEPDYLSILQIMRG